MTMKPCKNLDYAGEYLNCEIKTCAPHYPDVRYWRRNKVMYEGAAVNVQFCKKHGRINGIFDCYTSGEMPCYECDAEPDAIDRTGAAYMLAIVNVSPEDAPMIGVNQYEVRINKRVIASFEHHRKLNGAAQLLRDAADAVETAVKREVAEDLKRFLNSDSLAASGLVPADYQIVSGDKGSKP